MALKKLLTKLEKGSQLQGEAMQEAFPSHFQFNNGGSTFGNSTSIFDGNNFEQKSFTFGKKSGRFYDKPRQGFSREPFINKKSNIPDLDKGPSRFLGFIDSFSDGFIRGGISTAIEHSAKDVVRLGKFFLSQRGIGFLTQQLALQAAQPDILAGNAGGKIGEFVSGITGLSLNNNRTFNLGLNILGQAAVNFTGVHLNRSGLSPIWQDSATYAKLVKEKADVGIDLFGKPDPITGERSLSSPIKNNEIGDKGEGRVGNRLITLYNGRMVGESFNKEIETKERSGFGEFLQKIGDKVKSLTGEAGNSVLYEYKKGPGSIYGLGKTTIYRYQNSEIPARYITDGVDSAKESYPLTIDINGYNKLGANSTIQERSKHSFVNKRLEESFDRVSDGYRENRIKTGNPANFLLRLKGKNENRYNVYNESTIDKVNALDIFQSGLKGAKAYNRDLIAFYFDILTPGSKGNISHRIVFRAFLDSFSTNFSGNWNKFNYAGRGEPFYTYDNFDRTIDFSFKIAAQSRFEMRPLYRKLNYLASTTAPTYGNGRMRGTFVKAKIGSLINNTPGFFNSINISWNKDYPWEIAMDSPEGGNDTDMIVVPHVLDVSCNFVPIHNFIPKTSIFSPFILNNAADWLSRGSTEEGNLESYGAVGKDGFLLPQDPTRNNPPAPSLNSKNVNSIDNPAPTGLIDTRGRTVPSTPTPDINPNTGLPGAMGSEGY